MKITAKHYQSGEVVEITFNGGKLAGIRPVRKKSAIWLWGPGFFDIQVNGFGGVDYHRSDFTPEKLRLSIHEMWKHGTTHVMPTIVTETLENMSARLATIDEACRKYADVSSSVPAIHQEGPYFANVEGVRGAHQPECIIPPTVAHFEQLQKAAGGRIRMVTLAPEVEGALQFIREMKKRKVVISIGHSNATPDEITRGVEAGAVTSTHLGNGSAQMLPRHHNYMLAQLGEDRLYASFIPDGIHLPRFVLQTFLRSKPADKRILTTDAMSAAGAPPGTYSIGWISVEVGADRVVRQPGKSNFAGSAITMTEGFANAVRLGGASIAEAWDMSSIHPWKLMKGAADYPMPSIKDTFIIGRMKGDRFEVKATVKGKKLVYEGS